MDPTRLPRPASLAILAALALGLPACAIPGLGPAKAAVAPPPPPPPEVGVMVLAGQKVDLTTNLPARSVPYRIAEIRPQVNGVLQKRLFEEGSEVTEGQQLYQIDPAPYKAQLDSAQASLDRARAQVVLAQLTLERYQPLLASAVISKQAFDEAVAALGQAKADVASGEAMVESARINLVFTRVLSPISGRTGRSLTEGALVTANQSAPLVTVQQLDPIYVDIPQATEAMLRQRREARQAKPAAGDRPPVAVTLSLEDGSAYEQPGRLQFDDITVTEGTGSVIRRAVFPNPQQELLPGMYVMAHIAEGVIEQGILVSQRAVTRDVHGQATALVVGADDTVELRVVTTGRTIGDAWLISDGLKAGERVIVEGLQRVQPGMAVHPVPFAAPAK
jgi:membrane fusion protein (multidrug efflux system)